MKNFFRLTILAAAVVGLSACGGGAKLGGGKKGAAQALFQAGNATDQKGGQRILNILQSGAVETAAVTVECTHGGSATLSIDTDGTFKNDGTGTFTGSFDVEFDGCSEDGKNELDGSMTMGFYTVTTNSTAQLKLKMKGKIEFSGEISDFIDADITETVDVSVTNGNSVNVTVKLNGKIATSEETYTYNNETFTFDGSAELPAEEEDDEA
jgi:hypothetical protein